MALCDTATQEETLLAPRNQEIVVGQNLQLPPNHLFSDNSELVVGASPHTQWMATIKEQNAQLVTGRGSPTDYSPRNQEMVVQLVTGRGSPTDYSPRNQEMVVGQSLQLSPNHLFSNNSELVVGVSPHTRWLAAIKEQNAQLVTGSWCITTHPMAGCYKGTKCTTSDWQRVPNRLLSKKPRNGGSTSDWQRVPNRLLSKKPRNGGWTEPPVIT